MSKCLSCGSIYLEHWKEYIFTNNHEWINCTNCDNLWIKRPGTGKIKAEKYVQILGRKAKKNILKNTQLTWQDIL